jgi:hypothetical protein
LIRFRPVAIERTEVAGAEMKTSPSVGVCSGTAIAAGAATPTGYL